MDASIPRGGARAGFILLAVTLLVLAFPAARESALLLPALLVAGAGFIALGVADGPPVTRVAGAAFATYVVGLLALFLLAMPFTYGSDAGPVFEKAGYAWADAAFDHALQALPVVLILGAGLAAWPWGPLAGRLAVVVGVLLVGGFLVMDWLSEPASLTSVAGAQRFARLASTFMSLAAFALVAALALLFRPWERVSRGAS